jgi:chemotaxis protein CheD
MDLGKFADSALDAMLKQMKRMGARLGQLEGMIFGGADMFADILNKNVLAIGERNIAAALEQLNSNRIPLVAEETGGSVGRTVILNTQDGSVMVRSAKDEERLYRRERRVWPLVS